MWLPWSKHFPSVCVCVCCLYQKCTLHTLCLVFEDFIFPSRPRTHPPLISWSVNQGEKIWRKTNQPPDRKIPAKHLCTTALFLLSPLPLYFPFPEPVPPVCEKLLPLISFLQFEALSTLGHVYSHEHCSLLSDCCIAVLRLIFLQPPTMCIWRKLINYVIMSLIIYPALCIPEHERNISFSIVLKNCDQCCCHLKY